MNAHALKTDPESFEAVYRGNKSHEIRFNDRNYQVGDQVILQETKWSAEMMKYRPEIYPLIFTGREIKASISHIQKGYGLARDWCVLSLHVYFKA